MINNGWGTFNPSSTYGFAASLSYGLGGLFAADLDGDGGGHMQLERAPTPALVHTGSH